MEELEELRLELEDQLLVEMLRTHEQILMHGEPFHRSDLRGSAKDGFAGNVSVGDGAFARRRSAPLGLLEEIASKAAGRRVVGLPLLETLETIQLLRAALPVWVRLGVLQTLAEPPDLALVGAQRG